MEDFFLMDKLNRGQDACDEELGLILCKLMTKAYLIPKVTTWQKIHD